MTLQPISAAPRDNALDSKQLKNWRTVLYGMIGPWAILMPDEDVQKMRDEIQRRCDEEASK